MIIYVKDVQIHMETRQNLKNTCYDFLNRRFATSCMHSNHKTKGNDWYLKTDPRMWIAADFKRMNVPLESANENDSMKKLFVNKPFAIHYNIVKILIMIT